MGVATIFNQYRSLCDNKGILKEQFRSVADKGFHHGINFIDNFNDELVRFVLSQIHDQFMWLDRPHKITKEAIHVVIGFCSTGEVSLLSSVLKNDVEKIIGSRWDGKTMMVNKINGLAMKYASMVIGYRIFYNSRSMNNISAATIHTAYQMVKENMDYDLAEAMRSQLMANLEVMKKDKRLRFKFGQLILGLFFYFQNFFLESVMFNGSKVPLQYYR